MRHLPPLSGGVWGASFWPRFAVACLLANRAAEVRQSLARTLPSKRRAEGPQNLGLNNPFQLNEPPVERIAPDERSDTTASGRNPDRNFQRPSTPDWAERSDGPHRIVRRSHD